MVSMLRVPSRNAGYSSVNAPWTYFFSPAGPDRSVVSSNPATGAAAISVRISRTGSLTRPGGPAQAGVDEPGRQHAAREVGDQELRPLDRDVLEDRQVNGHGRQARPDRQRRVRYPRRARGDMDPPARAPRAVQVMLVADRRAGLRDVLLLIGPGNAQVSGTRELQAAPAGPLREVIDDLVRPAPAHRRARCAGLLPRLPLLLRPLGGAPLPPRRRPPAGQVIAARRHRGVPRVPGRGPQGRVQLPPQLRDQRRQRRDLPRLLSDQRITRILRQQRLGHATRSSPKPAPPASATHASQPNRNPGICNPASPKTQSQQGGRECLLSSIPRLRLTG